jgi:hypothetical protein
MGTLVLDATTKTIQAVMSGAAATSNPEFTAAYADSTSSSLTEGANDGALNGTTAVQLVGSPGASTRRVIKWITIQNKDTAPVTITITYNNSSGSTSRQIAKVTLAVNETWTIDGTFTTSGGLKTGGVTGPGSATDNAITRFDGTSGAAIQNSSASVDDNGAGTFIGTVNVSGTSSGPADLRLYEDTDNGTNYVALTAPSSLAANRTVNIPDGGGTVTLGYLNVPVSSTTTTMVVADVGKVVSLSAGIIVPNSTFAAGDVVSLYNNTSGNLTITTLNQIATAYVAGTNTNRGGASGSNLTLATRGVATVLFISATECVITGNVS